MQKAIFGAFLTVALLGALFAAQVQVPTTGGGGGGGAAGPAGTINTSDGAGNFVATGASATLAVTSTGGATPSISLSDAAHANSIAMLGNGGIALTATNSKTVTFLGSNGGSMTFTPSSNSLVVEKGTFQVNNQQNGSGGAGFNIAFGNTVADTDATGGDFEIGNEYSAADQTGGVRGIRTFAFNDSLNALAYMAGFYASTNDCAGGMAVCTNNYGFYSEAQTSGVNNYAFYGAGAGKLSIQDAFEQRGSTSGSINHMVPATVTSYSLTWPGAVGATGQALALSAVSGTAATMAWTNVAGPNLAGNITLGATPPIFANNAAAISGGLVAGNVYRTGADPDVLCIVH